jgi:hypothetical protein
MADIPSRLFRSVPRWHFKTEQELLTFFNYNFPLQQQKMWTVYHPSIELGMHVISILRTRHSMLADWWRLPTAGNHVGRIGLPMSHLWEWTLHYRESPLEQKADFSQDLRRESRKYITDKGPQSVLEQYVQLSRPLDRRLPWPMEKTLPKR